MEKKGVNVSKWGENGVKSKTFSFTTLQGNPSWATTVSVQYFTVHPQSSDCLEFCRTKLSRLDGVFTVEVLK